MHQDGGTPSVNIWLTVITSGVNSMVAASKMWSWKPKICLALQLQCRCSTGTEQFHELNTRGEVSTPKVRWQPP